MSGMLIVGCLMYLSMSLFGHYYIEGIGFATIQDSLNNQIIDPWLLLFLVLAKLLATCVTLGSGCNWWDIFTLIIYRSNIRKRFCNYD